MCNTERQLQMILAETARDLSTGPSINDAKFLDGDEKSNKWIRDRKEAIWILNSNQETVIGRKSPIQLIAKIDKMAINFSMGLLSPFPIAN